ncbi:cytochrome c biogenesis protein [Chitinophaga horti]|uniref:Cytochrome c biogenesis protein n=1 Tax=Chitinophaga horti TaxID=2920382 RepID=A0ABY6J5S9_9BACT|nr:cytochrome c biogenesis protein [Chitinophaga horti]UYQ93602.1 cytochrome c biogenesis protein [Chitinophaga horti]
MAKHWWKILSVIIILYTIIVGLSVKIPIIANNEETSRNLFYHVPMWIAMYTQFTISLVASIMYLASNDLRKDIWASSAGSVGVLFGLMGFATGSLWATYTWGGTITDDPKQISTALALLIYLAYLVLRSSFHDIDKRARVSAIFNVFAFALLIPLTYIIPRMVDSLHPGSTSSPGFKAADTEGTMMRIFYPAMIGWALFSVWLATLRVRFRKLALKKIIHA